MYYSRKFVNTPTFVKLEEIIKQSKSLRIILFYNISF